MKKLFFAIIATTLFASCTKEKFDLEMNDRIEAYELTKVPNNEISLETDLNGEPILSFRTEEDMFDQIDYILSMTEKDRNEWYSNFNNFKSQSNFRWDVVNEIDNTNSIDELTAIQKKHNGLLLFNPDKEEQDFSPYLPTSHIGTEAVCNKYGNVQINGKICNYNDIKSFNGLKTCITRLDGLKIAAGVHASTKDRKYWIESYFSPYNGNIYI